MDIILRNLNFNYDGKTRILKDINLEFPSGQLTVILGPSGCGKTTLLRCIAGLETSYDGQVLMGREELSTINPSNRNISMIFQDFALYLSLSVKENIVLSLVSNKVPKKEIEKRLINVAHMLGIKNILDKKVMKLSGGERQRVAIARSFIRNPKLMLLDEPFANLDAELKKQIRQEFKENQRKLVLSSIMVTHDQVEAIELAEQIVVMKDGEIQQVGSVEDIYTKPSNLFVATFVGYPRMNIFESNITDLNIGNEQIKYVGIRPENIKLVQDDIFGHKKYIWNAQLKDMFFNIPYYQYTFKTKYGNVNMIQTSKLHLAIGDNCKLTFEESDIIRIKA